MTKVERAPARRQAGRHSGPARERPPRRRVLLLGLEVGASILAWLVLVYLAIQFGPAARNGDHGAWLMLGTATLGAVLCLFLALVLGARLGTTLRERRRPPSIPGGRRAKR